MPSSAVERQKKDFIMISFAVLFIVLFLSMLLNYVIADIQNLTGFTVIDDSGAVRARFAADNLKIFTTTVKCVFAAAVVLTIVFYQTARLKRYGFDKAFIILLNLFAAIDFLFIFADAGGSVNVFDIVTTLYIVISVSVLVWIVFWIVKRNAKESFYAFLNELRVSLTVMTAIILTEGIFTAIKIASNGSGEPPETALISTYMFFASAALCAQLTHTALLNVKNLAAKIAAITMLFSGLVYGISLLPFLRGLGARLPVNAVVVIASVFGAATVTLFCISLYRAGSPKNRKIHVKSAVLTAAGFAMSLLFAEGIADIGTGLKTVFYIISVALSVGFLIFFLVTYKYENELTASAAAEEVEDGEKLAAPIIEDCDGQFGEIGESVGSGGENTAQNDENDYKNTRNADQNDENFARNVENNDDQNGYGEENGVRNEENSDGQSDIKIEDVERLVDSSEE